MIVVLNGPLGIGKSTLAEALGETLDGCVMLDGDHLIAANPPAKDELEHLHSTIALLVEHHARFGYRHFVINHYWHSAADLADLRGRLRALNDDTDIHCFLLTLPLEENLQRIARRQQHRAIDEREFEATTVAAEREALYSTTDGTLGEPFDVSAPPAELVSTMLRRLGVR